MNLKILLILFAVGFGGIIAFPFYSPAVSALVYLLPFFIYVAYVNIFPAYFGSLSVDDQKKINTEKWKSLIRSLKQVAGALVMVGAFGVKIPYIGMINDLLNHILGQFDAVAAAIQLLIGFGLQAWGFFQNDERFQARLSSSKRIK